MKENKNAYNFKKFFKQHKSTILILLLLFILLLEILLTIIYEYNVYTVDKMNSDFAGDTIFAKNLAEEGKLIFSKNWYPTTELYVVHHQLIMTPLFYIFDDYRLVTTISAGIAFILLACTFYYFLKTLNCSKIKSLLILVLIFNPVNYFLHAFAILFQGYLFYVILQILYITLILRLLHKTLNKVELLLFYIISFCIGMCGIRLFIILYVPLVLLLLLENLNWKLDKNALKDKKNLLVLGTFLTSIIAYLIYTMYLCPKYSFDGNIAMFGLDNTNINSNILHIIPSFLDSIGFSISNIAIKSMQFIIQAIKLLFWLLIIVENIYLAFFNKERTIAKIIAKFNILCIIVTLGSMILTSDTFVESSRYIGLSCFLLMPTSLANIKKPDLKIKSILIYALIIVTILVGFVQYITEIKKCGTIDNERDGYISFLDKGNYKFGIATYWNANITTFLSKNQIEIMPIDSPDNLEIFRWNTKKSYQELEPEFLILTSSELKDLNTNSYESQIVYEDDNYVVIDFRKEG